MAITLIAGLASAGSAWAAAGFAMSLSAAFGAFAIGAGLSLVSRALMPKPDIGSQMGGRSVTAREAAHSRKIIYGRARIGGNIVYLETTGTDNKYLWLVVAVAGHEIDAYESVWFNDKKIWGDGNYFNNWGSYVQIGFFKGNQTTADNTTVSPRTDNLVNASSKWTDDHKLLDTAYMVLRLEHDVDKFAQGLPNISTIVRGKKVLDPTSITAGSFVVGKKYQISAVGNTNFTAIGASANTVGVEFTATGVGSGTGTALLIDWSDNPALCAYDYLRDTKYGLGETVANILTASVKTAKGVCDETVSLAAGGTQKRYTTNGVVDTANSIKSNIEQMLGSMIGRLVYSGGQFEIHAGAYVAPAFTVDESVAVGEITVQTKQSRRSAYNGVKGVFLSEDDNYILADYPAQLSTSYATADGDPIYLDMALPFTTNNIRAQRIAKLALFRSRQQESITIPCNLSALRFKVGENINVTNTRLGYSNKIFEVVGYSMAFASDGQIVVNVDAIETASSIWAWATSDEEVFLGGGEVALYDGTVAVAPTSINVTSDSFLSDDGTFNSQFKVAWVNADDAFTDHYIVEWKLASVSDYFSQTTKSTPFSIVNLVNNASYNVRVKAVNEIGVSSAYLSATPTSAVDTTPPSVPTNPAAHGEYRQITVSWTPPTEKDLKLVEVFRSETVGGTYNYVGNGDTSFIDTDLDTPREYFYKIRSSDFTFNKSAFTAIISATSKNVNITAPDNPDVIIYDGESGLPPSVTSGRTSLDTNTSTFYLKQDYKESLKLHLTYPVGALTSGSVAGQTNAINATMAAFKFQVFYALTSSPTSFTQLGLDVSSVRRTTTGQLISNYYVKTTDLGGGNFQADLQTASQVQALFPTLDGLSLGIIDDNYNLRETLLAYDFPAGEYVFKVVVTVTDGSASSYPATGSPATNLKRKIDAVGYEVFKKSGHTFALKPLYQPITIFRDDSSNEIVRLSEGADTLELSAINSSGVPVQAFVGGGASSETAWGARIQFDDDLDSYTNGGIGQYQIGIDKSGTRLSLGTAPSSGGYPKGLNPSLSELQISSGRTDIKGTLYLNDVAVGTGSGTISNVIAGTNLNGGGTSGAVTLNLDSTITGNHTFSGTISSGAITSSAGISGTTAAFTDTVTMSGSGTLNITKGLGVYITNNLSVSGLIYNTDGSDVVLYGDTSISSGDLDVSGALSKGSGSFKIEHPLAEKRETHNLVHSFVEAPQADNIYRGKVTLIDGSATVNIDTVAEMSEGTYVLLNTNTQCFTSNESGWTAVKGLVSENILTIESQEPCSDTISWMVVGERHDQHMIDTKWTDENGKVIVEPKKTFDANSDKINKLKAQLSKK